MSLNHSWRTKGRGTTSTSTFISGYDLERASQTASGIETEGAPWATTVKPPSDLERNGRPRDMRTPDGEMMSNHSTLAVVPLQLVAEDIQTSPELPDGSYVVRLHVRLPGGMLKRPGGLLGPDGIPLNALQGAVVGVPSVQILFRKDRLGEDFLKKVEAESLVDGQEK
jgi:hypothetical protein